jgi:hypothetical protein
MTFEKWASASLPAMSTAGKPRSIASNGATRSRPNVYLVIGELPVQEIHTALAMTILQPLWIAKPETASRFCPRRRR